MTKPSYEELRTFPIQRGTPIPWALAEVAYRTYAARHSGQSLERLAERGGFGWHEFLHLYFGDIDWKLTDAQVEERWKADKEQQLTTELARVRGLLQRGFALMNGMGGKHGSLGQMDGWLILFDTLEEALAGAESADIGKLDAVDKTVKLNECNRHDDCAAAEAAVLARHPGKTISLTFHCHDDECEDCFGQ